MGATKLQSYCQENTTRNHNCFRESSPPSDSFTGLTERDSQSHFCFCYGATHRCYWQGSLVLTLPAFPVVWTALFRIGFVSLTIQSFSLASKLVDDGAKRKCFLPANNSRRFAGSLIGLILYLRGTLPITPCRQSPPLSGL